MIQNLGKLEQIDLRLIWEKEHKDFTPWLAENLHFLSGAIGIELELEAVEQSVGNFRADILAKDVQTNSWVLVENQLEKTDHGHLGQLITYAAGLNAAIIVWIAEQFADEHLAALEWLNAITDTSVRFYGIQAEVWCINNEAALRLNVVSKPNTWVKKGNNYKYSSGRRFSHAEVVAFKEAHPELTYKEVADRLGISERKVYLAVTWQKEQSV